MTIKTINANILDASEDIIVHQVNCLGVMGAGLAKQIKSKFPVVFKDYKTFVNNSNNLLGKNLMVVSDGSDIIKYKKNSGLKIISNLFAQENIARSEKQTDEIAFEKAFGHLIAFAKINNYSIAIPYGIGCGLGGGDWNKIYKTIKDLSKDCNITIYKL